MQIVLNFLETAEAFRLCMFVMPVWGRTGCLKILDWHSRMLRIRPQAWMQRGDVGAILNDSEFCQTLVMESHQCLHDAALQVAFVTENQHIISIEPTALLATPPQGMDCFPVAYDSAEYCRRIFQFSSEDVWWASLEKGLFWSREGSMEDSDSESQEEMSTQPSRSCRGVPGFTGSKEPFKMPLDVAAILALNGAWYESRILDRSLQAILLLRDGRFALVGACEHVGTSLLDSACQAGQCLVAKSLLALVNLGQDPTSRMLLGTTAPKGKIAALPLEQPSFSKYNLHLSPMPAPGVFWWARDLIDKDPTEVTMTNTEVFISVWQPWSDSFRPRTHPSESEKHEPSARHILSRPPFRVSRSKFRAIRFAESI